VQDVLASIGVAAIAGATYGLIGYFKNKKQEKAFAGFDKTEFITSILGSAVIGGLASFMGLSPDVVTDMAIGPFIFQTIRKALQALGM
jgi:hypothetical protein